MANIIFKFYSESIQNELDFIHREIQSVDISRQELDLILMSYYLSRHANLAVEGIVNRWCDIAISTRLRRGIGNLARDMSEDNEHDLWYTLSRLLRNKSTVYDIRHIAKGRYLIKVR